MLCAEGKHFCAGADFGSRGPDGVSRGTKRGRHLYKEAQRLWRTGKPIVAAVHGAAVGAGVGLAVMADFRVTCPEARFSTNFTRLGFHPGFGLTATLPRLIGAQKAALLMYTGRRTDRRGGAGDRPGGLLRAAGPGAAKARRSRPRSPSRHRWRSLRRGKRCDVAWPRRWPATEREYEEQDWLRNTEDFREGSRRWPSAACRISRRANDGSQRQL